MAATPPAFLNRQPLALYEGPGSRRGLALVTVLWVLMLLALIAASFTKTTRLEINLTRNLIENAKAEALADAGVYRAIYAVLANENEPRFPATCFISLTN